MKTTFKINYPLLCNIMQIREVIDTNEMIKKRKRNLSVKTVNPKLK